MWIQNSRQTDHALFFRISISMKQYTRNLILRTVEGSQTSRVTWYFQPLRRLQFCSLHLGRGESPPLAKGRGERVSPGGPTRRLGSWGTPVITPSIAIRREEYQIRSIIRSDISSVGTCVPTVQRTFPQKSVLHIDPFLYLPS